MTISGKDFREAARLTARTSRVGGQTHPLATLAVLIATHYLGGPLSAAALAFALSMIGAAWRWLGAQHLLKLTTFSRRQWWAQVAAPIVLVNLVWALLAAAILWSHGLDTMALLVLLGSIALAFGCMTSFAPLRELSLPLLLIHLGPVLLTTLMHRGPDWNLTSLLLIAFLLYLLRIDNTLRQDYWRALHTRNHLSDAREQAEQANRAKDRFLANISHEVRTPLNGIVAPLELLQRTPLDDDQRHYAALIAASSHTLAQLIDDLLDFSKMAQGQIRLHPRSFAPRQLLQDTVDRHRQHARDKGLALQLTETEGLKDLWVEGDPLRIGQIIENLLTNALKFTDSGGVTIAASVRPANPGICLSVQITDTGCGIPEPLQQQIFEPFVQVDHSSTRRHAGSGLGLSICRQLTTLMHGTLSVSSDIGSGSVFTLTLELPRSEPAAAAAAANLPHFSGLRVLVAEDNLVNQQVIRQQLAQLGIAAEIVVNGSKVLEAVARERYDLILLDCQMPELDGYQTAARLRLDADPTRHRIPVIALTAHAMASDQAQALAAGMDDYLSKPVTLAQLALTIDKWVGNRPSNAP